MYNFGRAPLSERLGKELCSCRSAFTLIEVLVVVGIIALLVSILLPSLQRARNQAKNASCKANSKQIATMMSVYQAEYRGAVPVVFNWHAGPVYNVPARSVLLSVALRNYDKRSGRLPASFNPETVWPDAKKQAYEATLMPSYFSCPYVRDAAYGPVNNGTITLKGPAGSTIYTLAEWSGRYETYHTWLWEDIVHGQIPHGETYPYDPSQGRPKYTVLSWNKVAITPTATTPQIPDALSILDPAVKNLYRSWIPGDARRHKTASLSDLTVIYCAQGEHLELGHYLWNKGSHPGTLGGGTMTVFADSHVDWVRGTQLGWP